MFQKLLTFINHKKYLKKELIHSKNILDNINGYKLDYNQRLSIVCDEENTLVIAGAGSGKTLTIVGNIRYLIERKDYGNITIPASNGHYNLFEFPLCDLSKTFKLGEDKL